MNAAVEFHDTNQVPMNLNKWNAKQLGLRLWPITLVVFFFYHWLIFDNPVYANCIGGVKPKKK